VVDLSRTNATTLKLLVATSYVQKVAEILAGTTIEPFGGSADGGTSVGYQLHAA